MGSIWRQLAAKSSRSSRSHARVRTGVVAAVFATFVVNGTADSSLAGVVITPQASQDGWLEFTWTGSLDLTNATTNGQVGGMALFVGSSIGRLTASSTAVFNDRWIATGPSSFGTGSSFQNEVGGVVATSTGNASLALLSGFVIVPSTYTSGSSLSGTVTFANVPYASAQLTPGTYTWTITGSNDTVVMNVPVPEPATYAMVLAGLACGGFSVWRRRKRAC